MKTATRIDKGGHVQTWAFDPDMFCPACGTKAVWVRIDGHTHDFIAPDDCAACIQCGVQFDYPNVVQWPPINDLH